jgi:hypothetical protein
VRRKIWLKVVVVVVVVVVAVIWSYQCMKQ